jgi:futalosine hydrolase
MAGVLEGWGSGRAVLLAVAAPVEVRAVAGGLGAGGVLADWVEAALKPRLHLVQTGIGKVNAAAAVARIIDPTRHSAVISLGVAGALPGSSLQIGDCVVATASVYADEGLQTPEKFVDCAGMGFPLGPFAGSAVPVSPALLDLLKPLADRLGAVATVSTCSGTEVLAQQVAQRTGALAEGMEGAAVAHVCARLGLAFAEVRVISNTTGDRAAQRWDMPRALARLAAVSAGL